MILRQLPRPTPRNLCLSKYLRMHISLCLIFQFFEPLVNCYNRRYNIAARMPRLKYSYPSIHLNPVIFMRFRSFFKTIATFRLHSRILQSHHNATACLPLFIHRSQTFPSIRGGAKGDTLRGTWASFHEILSRSQFNLVPRSTSVLPGGTWNFKNWNSAKVESLRQCSGDEGRGSGEITLRRGCYLDVLVNGGEGTGEMYLARDLAESGTTGHWRRSAVCGSHGRVKRRQESWNGKGQWRPKEK